MQLAVGVIWYLVFLLISDLSRYNPGSPGPGVSGQEHKGDLLPPIFRAWVSLLRALALLGKPGHFPRS